MRAVSRWPVGGRAAPRCWSAAGIRAVEASPDPVRCVPGARVALAGVPANRGWVVASADPAADRAEDPPDDPAAEPAATVVSSALDTSPVRRSLRSPNAA